MGQCLLPEAKRLDGAAHTNRKIGTMCGMLSKEKDMDHGPQDPCDPWSLKEGSP